MLRKIYDDDKCIKKELTKEIRYFMENGNINFLIGAGASTPFLRTLGDLEGIFTYINKNINSESKKNKLLCIISNHYFKNSMYDMLNFKEKKHGKEILELYKNFYKYLNKIVFKRKSTILNKQVNIFTTNYDLFSEYALEDLSIEYNDGFSNKMIRKLDISNFDKLIYKKGLFFDNVIEIPTFNILKLHGSLSWRIGENEEVFFDDLKQLEKINDQKNLIDIEWDLINKVLESKDDIKKKIEKIENTNINKKKIDEFFEEYNKLLIVNPTKKKFKETLVNRIYYDLLRLYSNFLEKENSVLFVIGFSFADEHIRDLTIRALNNNPTLKIYFFSYSLEPNFPINEIESSIKNSNFDIIIGNNEKKMDFENINNIFEKIFSEECDINE